LVADINVIEIVEAFAKLEAFSQGVVKEWEGKTFSFSARNMGKHDLWIAATAKVLNLTLITTDRDFEHLSEIIDLKVINLDNYNS
jgi:predicted nuclease of predicted toxin-antitoxin system